MNLDIHAIIGSEGMAEWSKALDGFEWSALANSRSFYGPGFEYCSGQ